MTGGQWWYAYDLEKVNPKDCWEKEDTHEMEDTGALELGVFGRGAMKQSKR